MSNLVSNEAIDQAVPPVVHSQPIQSEQPVRILVNQILKLFKLDVAEILQGMEGKLSADLAEEISGVKDVPVAADLVYIADSSNALAPMMARIGALRGISGVVVTPPTRDSAGIATAVMLCGAAGGGTVIYEDAAYTCTADQILVDNVNHIGFPGKLSFVGDVPDAEFSVTGGTRWNLAAGVTGLYHNNVDKAVEETNIAMESCTGVKVYGITFVGGKRAIDAGAYLAMGMVYSEFDRLFAFDQTDDFAFNFINFQHCIFGALYTSTQLTSGSGMRFGSAMSATLLPGNSTFTGELYTYCKNRKNRSVVFEAFGPAGCILNQIKVSGRLQGNRYGSGTPDDISMSFTSGSADVLVSNAAQFELMQVGMPIVFTGTVPTGFETQTGYFVISRDAGAQTVRIAEAAHYAAGITPTSTGVFVSKCAGYPAIEIKANSTSSINNSDFGMIDAESFGNVCNVYVSKTRGCTAYLAEVMSSATNTAVICRDAEIGLTYAGKANLTTDKSGLAGSVNFTNLASGALDYSGGSFTLDASHNNRSIRYMGTTDITITAPLNLPSGFEFELIATGATGLVTFAVASGGSLYSSGSMFRTAGQYARARLKMYAPKRFGLSGNLQV